MLYGAIAASKIRPALVETALFAAAGSLSALASIDENPIKQGTASFAGNGQMSAAVSIKLQPNASFAGVGQMAAAASLTNPLQSGTAAFSGIGQMATNANIQSSQTAAFLARTTGLDSTHINAYSNLIDGLVADGIWAHLDALWVFATQDETTALLNLCSASYGMSKVLSPSFSADLGFTGDGSNYLDNGAALNSLSQFSQNSGHIMVWGLTSGGSIGGGITAGNDTYIVPKYNDAYAYFHVNSSTAVSGYPSTGKGCFIASRTSSDVEKGYKNGSEFASGPATSATVLSDHVKIPGGSTDRFAAGSVGAGLDATDASNLYSRLYTYLQAVGVSSPT